MSTTPVRSLGVEEEFLLVDPDTGNAKATGTAVLRAADADDDLTADLTAELQREQVETGTRPCFELEALGKELRNTRAQAREAAGSTGSALAPLATSPLPVDPTPSPAPRYHRMIELFGLTGSEALTCGCHVHVGVDSDEEGVAVLDRIRPWLPPLLALSANSPFWGGSDSGYASYRSQMWGRWPTAGPTDLFGSAANYHELTSTLVDTRAVLDIGMLYFDARLSSHLPTVEIRVADLCREPDDAVLIAGLVRGLVETAVRDWRAGQPPAPVPTPVLRLASWRAGRSGLDGDLVHPTGLRPVPAADAVAALLAHTRDALDETGDLALVQELLDELKARGNGAARQRAVFARTGDLREVVMDAIDVA